VIDIIEKKATVDDAVIVGTLVYKLLYELLPDKYREENSESFVESAGRLIGSDAIYAFLAKTKLNTPIGIVTLNACASIYARGYFGKICELYVEPEYRSDGVGTKLIDAARAFGLTLDWNHLEVGAPPLPRWQRTLNFYTSYGFSTIGPRLSIGLAK
jgi:GNAT superfamily N-acetyltransferase